MPKVTLKNLSGIPFDIPAISGPMILPANGEIDVELSDFDVEVFRASPFVDVIEEAQTEVRREAKREAKRP